MGHKLWLLLLVVLLAGCASKQPTVDELDSLPPTAAGELELNVHVWTGLNGKPVRALTRNRNYPQSPTSVERISVLDFPEERGDKYGQRIVGLLQPPETGNYRFWVASDDSAEVWISTDQTPDNKRLIAYNNKPTGYLNFTMFNSQRSPLISLQAGERYYFEVLHKEYAQNDYLNVSWEGPGVAFSPVSEEFLLPYGLADQVSGETAFKEGYHVGYTSGSMLTAYDDTYPPLDSDGDGLPDFYELAIGNDPNDVTDAFNDMDGDLLTAYEEYQIRTNPNNADSDGDGMPDGFEFVYGLSALNPADASLDLDGDGISNLDEYTAGTTPDDSADFPSGPAIRTVILQWEIPTSREDGSPLTPEEIGMYRIYAGNNQQELELFTEVNDPLQVSYASDFVEGQYYFAISTVTVDGLEGPMSSAIEVTVQ
ncbi:MAG: PA14 domain-containing protein [Oleiphilaceae bacterium]|nr:PA14 domain-containing protein [Oleiphilaceae bacterium]